MASCGKCNRRAAWRFEEQLLSCQPHATPCLRLFLRLFVRRYCCCERHTTRDEAQLEARQTSSQGLGPKLQRLEVRAHAAAGRTLFAD